MPEARKRKDYSHTLSNDLRHQHIDSYALSIRALDERKLAKQVYLATNKIFEQHPHLKKDHQLVLTGIKLVDGKYKVPFYNKKGEISYIYMNDPALYQLSQYFNADSPSTSHTATKRYHKNIPMSFYFVMRELLKLSNNSPNPEALNPVAQNLAHALEVHAYLNFAGLVTGLTQDTFSLGIDIYRFLNNKLSFLDPNLSKFLNNIPTEISTLQKVLPQLVDHSSTAFKGLTAGAKMITNQILRKIPLIDKLVNAGSVMMGGYEVAYAENATQKRVFATQLAFDIAGLLLPGPLALLGVPLAFIGEGVVETLKLYATIEEIVHQNVINYFAQVEKAYKEGYSYLANKKRLHFLSGAVIQAFDLETGEITLGTHYLLPRSPQESSQATNSRENAIDLKQAFAYSQPLEIDHKVRNAHTILLPDTPPSQIGYNTIDLLGTKYSDQAVGGRNSAIRQLERISNYQFQLEVHPNGLPTHVNLIYELVHQYQQQPATVEVNLDNQERALEVPTTLPQHNARRVPHYYRGNRAENISDPNTLSLSLPSSEIIIKDLPLGLAPQTSTEALNLRGGMDYVQEPLQQAIQYHLKGKGNQYSVLLRKGAGFKLSEKAQKTSSWIFDARLLDNDSIQIQQERIIIGNIPIDIDPSARNAQIFVIGKDHQSYSVDLAKSTPILLQIDASVWKEKSKEEVEALIKQYIQEHKLNWMHIVPIINFHALGKNVGQAYYESAKERILFTQRVVTPDLNSSSSSIKHQTIKEQVFLHGKLGAIVGNKIYFYCNYDPSETHKNIFQLTGKTSHIWGVEAQSGQVKESYAFQINPQHQSKADILQVWQESDQVLIARKEDGNKQSIYRLTEQGIQQVSLQTNIASFSTLNTLDQAHPINPLNYEQVRFQSDQTISTSQNQIQRASLFTAYGIDQASSKPYRYWIKNENGYQTLIKPNLPQQAKKDIAHLIMAGSLRDINGQEIFYFYDSLNQQLYRQKGNGTQRPIVRMGVPSRGGSPYPAPPPIPVAELINPEFKKYDLSTYRAKILNTFTSNQQLFALLEDGIIYQVDNQDKFTRQAISEEWIRLQGSHWIENLKSFQHETPLPIMGLKGIDGQESIVAWYYQEKLIVIPKLYSDKLQFVGVQNQQAFFLETVEGKLYKQDLINQTVLQNAFGNDHILDFDHFMKSAPVSIFLMDRFKEVSIEKNKLRLVTKKEGAILILDDTNNINWIGLDHQELTSIQALKEKYPHPDVIALGTDKNTDTLWYHFTLGKTFTSHTLTLQEQPIYLGMSKSTKGEITFYFNSKKGIVKYDLIGDGTRQQAADASLNQLDIQRIGDTLTIQGSDANDEIEPLWLEETNKIILTGGEGEDSYEINLNDDLKPTFDKHQRVIFREITLDNFDQQKKQNQLHIAIQHEHVTSLSRKNNDLKIAHRYDDIILRNAFADNRDFYNQLEIEFETQQSSKTYQLESIVQYMLAKDPNSTLLFPLTSLSSLSNLPDLNKDN